MTSAGHEFLGFQLALAGEYSLERELGRGGMGVVYLARDVQLDRHVAIKVLPSHLADGEARARFMREARTAAALSHPHIVPIHRVGEAGGSVYFVMSYVAGETLGERLRTRGPLPAAEALRIMREVAWALAYAHGHGIVHRDVKPDNILLEEGSGRALVTDFGIAHVGSATLSMDPGKIMGTAQFMSPEQATSEGVDGRSDLYSLGVVGYLAVSGRLPFEAANVPALLMKHVAEAPKPIAGIAPGLPRALADAIHKCLEKEPARRFASGEELASALAPSTDGRPALPAPLRNWLAERNPATIAYAVWSGLMGIPIFYNLTQLINYQQSAYLFDLIQMGVLAAVPIVPMVQYHATRARRLFRAGFNLEDLRGALDVAANEKRESDELDAEQPLTLAQKALRVVTYGAFSASMALTFLSDSIRLAFERQHILLPFDAYRFTTMGGWVVSLFLLAAMNANQVPLLPSIVRQSVRGGLREKLWRSRFGEFLARRMGAPVTSRPVGVGVFQATEMALGVAASDLFKALPLEYREQLGDLPAIVAALEARARGVRAELASLDVVERHAQDGPELASRRGAAKGRLAKSVAALESIRIDLLRLHAGASDLAPLTTLLDAARVLGDDLARLTDAQREVEAMLPSQRLGSERIPTPV